MKLVKQPKGSSLCGQACVAMLAGVSLEESTETFRTKGCTRYKALIQALRQLGVESAEKWKMGHPTGDAIIRFTNQELGCSHWVVFFKGKYYDPAGGVYRKLPKCLRKAKATSYLSVDLSAFQSSEDS